MLLNLYSISAYVFYINSGYYREGIVGYGFPPSPLPLLQYYEPHVGQHTQDPLWKGEAQPTQPLTARPVCNVLSLSASVSLGLAEMAARGQYNYLFYLSTYLPDG